MNQNQGHLERLDLQTGVYSLEYALDRLQQLASSPEADNYDGVSINITGMTILNNRFGMDNGTRILQVYVRSLQDLIGPDGFLARLGGDRFFAVYPREHRDQVIAFVKGVDLRIPEVTSKTVRVN